MMTRPRLALAGILAALSASPTLLGDDFVDRANALYANIPSAKRSDLVLLPLLARMDRAPAGGGEQLELLSAAQILTIRPGMAAWANHEGWINAPAQRAALDGLRQVARSAEGMVFAQPYGTQGVAVDLIRAGTYIDLGDPPTLAAADNGTLRKIEDLGLLAYLESARLAGEGKSFEAIELVLDWLSFARQYANRELSSEAREGFSQMVVAISTIRDIAYEDFRSGERKLTSANLLTILDRIRPEKLLIERIGFPDVDLIAAEQLVSQVFDSSGQPVAEFSTRMATMASREYPLRLFAEAAAWDMIAENHKDLLDTKTAVSRSAGDWSSRWALDPFDDRMKEPFHYDRVRQDPSLRVVTVALQDTGALFGLRRIFHTEAVGTRTSLGVLAYYYDFRNFPPLLASVRPRYLPEIEPDPFNPDRAFGRKPPMSYFVPHGPGYRTLGPRETPEPHVMNIVTPLHNFRARVDRDEFVIYSTGSDGASGWVERVENTFVYAPNADYLIWPPQISLLRRHLVQIGALK